MKKIGIITIQKCDNFGADLQAYALGAKLRSLGYEAENIDYLFYKHPRHQNGKNEAPIFKLSFKNRIKERIGPLFARFRRLRNGGGDAKRKELFRDFFSRYVPCGREYRSVKSLYDSPPEYDVYITGSDQVWNPRMGSNIKPYFLDFVPDGRRCISYAASIGVPVVSPVVYDTYAQLLSKYAAIGVREETSERIIAGMGLSAPVCTVVDPTLLLSAEEWQQIARQPHGVEPKSYVAEYNLQHNPQIHLLAECIAQRQNISVVDVTDGAYGPREFLWLIGHASAAVCSSFHGTVFSIINRVPFYSVYLDGATNNGGRIALFAKSLGLFDRMVKPSELSTVKIDLSMDYDSVHWKLDELRRKSVDFLIKSIEGSENPAQAKPNPDCYAIWATDPHVRELSTSGGAFSILARQVIDEGGVVFGAAYDEDFRHVRHRCARTIAELEPLMRSKYVYSDFLCSFDSIADELMAGRRVLFVGTPCQVAAVKARFANAGDLLITVDFVCHGTPKPDVFAAWIDDLQSRYGERVSCYEFRNKKRGWNFSESRVRFASGQIIDLPGYNDPYFMGFSLNAFLRECCYSCRYANLNRPGDLTIADCWRVAASHPEYDDGKGTSLLLVNSDAGRRLFESVDKKRYAGGPYDLRLARLRNMPLMMPAARSPFTGAFDATFKKTGSLVWASACYFTRKRRLRARVRGIVKRMAWFYLKYHQ